MDIYYTKLKEAVEKELGKKPFCNSDFSELSTLIYNRCHELLSTTTTKRFWGYLKSENPTPQKRTLNILSELVGFKNWKDFCEYIDTDNDFSSGFIEHDSQHSFLMAPNKCIRISWYPNRSVILKHEGNGEQFSVVESENSKLRPGMTLHCNTFTKKQVLCLQNVTGCGINVPCDYICGKIGGIDFELLD